jgi:hypothetical protein
VGSAAPLPFGRIDKTDHESRFVSVADAQQPNAAKNLVSLKTGLGADLAADLNSGFLVGVSLVVFSRNRDAISDCVR